MPSDRTHDLGTGVSEFHGQVEVTAGAARRPLVTENLTPDKCALRRRREVLSLPVRMWEWVVDEEAAHAFPRATGGAAGSASCGVSGTRHRAMDALSRSLIAAGRPARGRVIPVFLADGLSGFCYVRMAPVLTADCRMGVIRWS